MIDDPTAPANPAPIPSSTPDPNRRPRRDPIALAFCGLLVLHAALLAWSASRHTPNIDEMAHLPAGLSIWSTGRVVAYPVNPPLVKLIASAPVALMRPQADWGALDRDPALRPEWQLGREFIDLNGPRSFRLYTAARWACIPLSMLGALVCYRWSRELYGARSGLLAATLWCTCPNVLTWGATINPDLGAASLGALALYSLWAWMRRGSWALAIAMGACLGLAASAKSTLLVLFPISLLFAMLWPRPESLGAIAFGCRARARQLGASWVVAILVINAFYGFEGAFRSLGSYRFVSKALSGCRQENYAVPQPGNRFSGTWLGALPVPLPEMYLRGLDIQRRDFEQGAWSYLRGEWRFGGWWYYYLYALTVKAPAGTLALTALAVGLTFARREYRQQWKDELFLIAPAAAVLILVSSQTGFSRYLRYLLPIFPAWYIWISKVGLSWPWRHSIVAAMAIALCSWSVVSSLRAYPHTLSYFNEWAGGTAGGHWHLLDANVDWGQDLLYFKEWVDAHPEARPLRSVLVDPFALRHLGLPEYLPRIEETTSTDRRRSGLAPGWYAISIHHLHDREHAFDELLYGMKPDFVVAGSIYVYFID